MNAESASTRLGMLTPSSNTVLEPSCTHSPAALVAAVTALVERRVDNVANCCCIPFQTDNR